MPKLTFVSVGFCCSILPLQFAADSVREVLCVQLFHLSVCGRMYHCALAARAIIIIIVVVGLRLWPLLFALDRCVRARSFDVMRGARVYHENEIVLSGVKAECG